MTKITTQTAPELQQAEPGGTPGKKKPVLRNRDVANRFYTTRAEWQAIGKKAAKAGMSRSTFIRHSIANARVRPRLTPQEMALYKHCIALAGTLETLQQQSLEQGFTRIEGQLSAAISRLNYWLKRMHDDW